MDVNTQPRTRSSLDGRFLFPSLRQSVCHLVGMLPGAGKKGGKDVVVDGSLDGSNSLIAQERCCQAEHAV